MGIDHIEKLRVSFPSHFQDRDPDVPDEEFLRIPTGDPDAYRRRGDDEQQEEQSVGTEAALSVPDPGEVIEAVLADMPVDFPLDPIPENSEGVFRGHPGGLTNDPPHRDGGSTSIDRLAFYLPFHLYPNWWGIYILPEGIQRLRCELHNFFHAHGVPALDQVKIAKRLLYYHEFYHHATESFATRLEAILNQPCYLDGFTPLYRSTFATPRCLEETCANSYAREKTIARPAKLGVTKQVYRAAIDDWFIGSPPGYAEAAGTGTQWASNIRPEFYEVCLNSCLPLVGARARSLGAAERKTAWSAAGYYDRGIGDVSSRISYLIKKGSYFHTRLPIDVRTCIKGRSFKQKISDLGIGQYYKEGKRHELWIPTAGGRPVPIPRHDGVDIPKGTMRAILRQLGSTLSIEQFLSA